MDPRKWMTKKFFLALTGLGLGGAAFFMGQLNQDGLLWVMGISVAPYTVANGAEKALAVLKR